MNPIRDGGEVNDSLRTGQLRFPSARSALILFACDCRDRVDLLLVTRQRTSDPAVSAGKSELHRTNIVICKRCRRFPESWPRASHCGELATLKFPVYWYADCVNTIRIDPITHIK